MTSHQVDTSADCIDFIKSIPLLYLWLSSSRYLCCIWLIMSIWYYDYHQVDTSAVFMTYDSQVDTSAVFMTIIKSIPLLYLWLSSSRYLCCIDDYHQFDTAAVFDITIIKSIPLLYWWLSLQSIVDTSRLPLLFLINSHKYSSDDSHHQVRVDTAMLYLWSIIKSIPAVLMPIIKSTPLYSHMTIIKSIPLLYWCLSSSRYICCI